MKIPSEIFDVELCELIVKNYNQRLEAILSKAMTL
jgi:hypothetical protein